VTVPSEQLERIDRAFADLLSCLFGDTANRGRSVTVWSSPPATHDAMRRWVNGHLTFAVLTQGLIISFRALGQALRNGQEEEVSRWADLSVSLFRGSSGAFLFTGDFAPGEYENIIRPSMSPPALPICLSGLMSADHRYLSLLLRDMRPALTLLAERDPERHEEMAAALAGVYDSHIHVCERFVGARPSLLTQERTEKPAPSQLEQFRTLRLKAFEHEPPEARPARPRPAATLGECPFHH
jgi:hypothetical protein